MQATGSLRLFISTTSGFTGASEPSWPTTTSQTVNDGDIVWKCWTEHGSSCVSGNNPWTIKNNFELKSARNVHVHHNVFDQLWWTRRRRRSISRMKIGDPWWEAHAFLITPAVSTPQPMGKTIL